MIYICIIYKRVAYCRFFLQTKISIQLLSSPMVSSALQFKKASAQSTRTFMGSSQCNSKRFLQRLVKVARKKADSNVQLSSLVPDEGKSAKDHFMTILPNDDTKVSKKPLTKSILQKQSSTRKKGHAIQCQTELLTPPHNSNHVSTSTNVDNTKITSEYAKPMINQTCATESFLNIVESRSFHFSHTDCYPDAASTNTKWWELPKTGHRLPKLPDRPSHWNQNEVMSLSSYVARLRHEAQYPQLSMSS